MLHWVLLVLVLLPLRLLLRLLSALCCCCCRCVCVCCRRCVCPCICRCRQVLPMAVEAVRVSELPSRRMLACALFRGMARGRLLSQENIQQT